MGECIRVYRFACTSGAAIKEHKVHSKMSVMEGGGK